MIDVLKRLNDIMISKKISSYQLSKLSGVPQSTINTMFRKNSSPSIYTLEKLCESLNISLSEFFTTPSSKVKNDVALDELLEMWGKLTDKQKKAIVVIAESMNE